MGLFHIMLIGLSSPLLTQPWFSFLVGMFQHQLILVADFPFGFRGVKSVYTDLKASQVHVPDTGNSQVKGEQLHKCSVGTKARFLFCQSSSDIWYIMVMARKSWKSVSNWICKLWSYIVNVIPKNILWLLLLNALGFSYKMLCCPVTQSNFFKHPAAWNNLYGGHWSRAWYLSI